MFSCLPINAGCVSVNIYDSTKDMQSIISEILFSFHDKIHLGEFALTSCRQNDYSGSFGLSRLFFGS